jgi:hypothetical protein
MPFGKGIHMGQIFPGTGLAVLKPVKQDRHGLAWDAAMVQEHCAADILNGNYLERRARGFMTQDFEKAAKVCDEATKMFNASFNHMLAAEGKISDAAKKTSGNVRKAADDLHSGLQKIEKAANFDRLERAVSVLERAAAALTVLAELEKDGKLERIASAVKA